MSDEIHTWQVRPPLLVVSTSVGKRETGSPEPCRLPSTPSLTTLTALASPYLVTSRINHLGVSCLSLPAHPSVPRTLMPIRLCNALLWPHLPDPTPQIFKSHSRWKNWRALGLEEMFLSQMGFAVMVESNEQKEGHFNHLLYSALRNSRAVVNLLSPASSLKFPFIILLS